MAGTAPRILVIDDDPPIRRVIRIAAESVGFSVLEAGDAAEAGIRIAMERPEVVILDLGLPDSDGLTLLRSVRAWSTVPVIVLTARAEESLVVDALDAGADDFVSKPFSMLELLARIRLALRHAVASSGIKAKQHIGTLVIDHVARRVHLRDQEIKLTATEFDLLQYFATHLDKVLTVSNILRAIWGSGNADPQVLRVFVRQLRGKLEFDASHPSLITTVIGVGYRMNSPAESGDEQSAIDAS